MENPRNYLIQDVELNYPRLDQPVNPFGTEQYELQIATTDKAKAQELKDNHLNVKEKDGVYTVSLKRKARKQNGEDNGKVRVVNSNKEAFEDVRSIGNGSRGNVILFQYPYDTMGRKGVASSLTAVQITDHVVYTPQGSVDFDVIATAETPAETNSADLF